MIFLVSGIYWGQCMEVCGRYHHWMPIIVYFIKRDLFFLWCTHFVHTPASSTWSVNDRQYMNMLYPVSFDKSSWLLEINK
jgi:heme/copper-type cytochrome/quinol oxidase subunit 2